MFQRIKNNLKYIGSRFTILTSIIFGIISIVQMFVGWEVLGIEENDTNRKVILLISLLIFCGIIAIIWGIFFSNEITVFAQDDVEIKVKYDDLMKIAFPKKTEEERIVVIAVNCCFDMTINQNLIREHSVHGQFLKHFVHNESDQRLLEDSIKASLQELNVQYTQLTRTDKNHGNLMRYPLGTIARIPGNNGVTFFLMALTEFDMHCKAHCNKHQYVECMLKLFEYYDTHGQGMNLYLYPMGTSVARTGLTKKEALEAVVALTKISKEHLKSKTTIIVDKNNKNEIAITDI